MAEMPKKPTVRSATLAAGAVFLASIVALAFGPLREFHPTSSASAQGVSVSVQFRTALEPHGRWVRHSRWGEVWVPALPDREWRPYTVGRWVFTDQWGWFWVSDEDFGWITYHYGNWVLDRQLGWIWIPGDVWGPAWVQWRRGDRHAGWAPLPPRDVIYDYDDDPEFWIFVSINNFTAPNIRRVIVPPRERVVYIRETVVVNRTIIVERGPRIAVNPGIEPRIIAARVGRPIGVADVRPVVVAGTVGVQNAVEVRADQRQQRREVTRAQITERKETIEPAKDVPPPQALKKSEEGRLGDRPPAAAKEQAQRQPDTTKGQPDAAKGPLTKAQEDAAKTKADDAAKAKAKSDEAKAKADDAAKAKLDDARKAKDAVKSEPKSPSVGEKGKQLPTAKGEPEPKSPVQKGEGVKGPEPKLQPAAKPGGPQPKEAAPKSEPLQKQSAPAQKAQPQPQGGPAQPQAGAKGPEPKGAKSAPSGGKGGDEQKAKEKQ